MEGEQGSIAKAAHTKPISPPAETVWHSRRHGTIRVEDRTLKGYYRHQFIEAWDRYYAEEAEGVTNRHNVTTLLPQGLPPLLNRHNPSPM